MSKNKSMNLLLSARDRAEAELRESQQLLASVADNISEAIYRTGPEHDLIFANRAYLRMSGYDSLEEMQKMRREELYANPADRARLLDLLEREDGFRNLELEYIRRDGHRWWGLNNGVTVRDPDTSEVLYHVGSIADITERKQAEAALQESEARFRRMFQHSSDAVSLLDTGTGRFVDVNPAAVRLLGFASRADMIGMSTDQGSPEFQPDGRRSSEKAAELIARAIKDGGIRFEWDCLRGDGKIVPLEIAATPIEPGGRPLLLIVSRDITERRQAEAKVQQMNGTLEQRIAERTRELSESEARLRTLVEHAPEAIVVFDGDTGQFISGNERVCELFGCGSDALPQLNPEAVSPEFQADGQPTARLAREKIDEALAGGTPVFEWMHRHVSGRLIPTEVRLVRLPGVKPRLIRASIIDNSERKRRETIQRATFRISEAAHTAEHLDALFADIHGIVKTLMPANSFYIALADPDGRTFSFPYLVDEHELWARPMPIDKGWTGYVLLTGRPLLAGRHNLVAGDALKVITETGEVVQGIDCGTRPPPIWLGAPLSIRGKTIGVVVLQDYNNPKAYGEEEKRILTFVGGQIALAIERKRAGDALRESEEKFRAFFEASSAGVMIHDEEKYLAVNSAAAEMLGYQHPSEMVGLNPVATSPPFQPGGIPTEVLARRHINECLELGSARFDWLAKHTDGRELPVEVILTRIEMGGRRVIQAMVNDISERKRAEAELLRSLAREKELSQLKTNFVSMISHEFRTPLGIILSSAEILDEYLDQLTPEERKEQLQSIQKNSRRMAGLMEEALLLGRFEAGKMDFKPAPLDLRLFCQRLLDEVHSATDRQCPIQILGEACKDAAHADDRLLRHIFINLLTNAVKYSPPGTPVEFHVAAQGANAVCVIRDRGIGIPESDREWLFEAFHRGRNVGERNGTGLGLTIVKRCVELHGGKIKIDSKVGEGTTVTVILPVFAGNSAREI